MRTRFGANGLIMRATAITLALIFSACATTGTYTTRAYPTVSQPSISSTDYNTWMTYYTDQFQSLGDKVKQPGVTYTDVAKKAYADARLNWDQQVSGAKQMEAQSTKAAHNTLLYGIGGGVALFVITLLVAGH